MRAVFKQVHKELLSQGFNWGGGKTDTVVNRMDIKMCHLYHFKL